MISSLLLLAIGAPLAIASPALPEIPVERATVRPLSEHLLRYRKMWQDTAAPQWKLPPGGKIMAKFDTQNVVNLTAFRLLVARMEDSLLATPPREGLSTITRSYGDDLPKLTARSDNYNLFYLDDPVVGQYYAVIKRSFHRLLDLYGLDKTRRYWLHGWANCFRLGQGIHWHAHGSVDGGQPVSGSFMVTVNASATLYRVGDLPRSVTDRHAPAFYAYDHNAGGTEMAGVLRNPNTPGDLLFFGSDIAHRSTVVDAEQARGFESVAGADCRISTSFDISTDEALDGNHHSVPLFDPANPYFEDGKAMQAMAREGAAIVRRLDRRRRELERGEAGGGYEDDDEEADGGGGAPPPLPCMDAHADCEGWSEMGECQANREWMYVHCRRACGLCGHTGDGRDVGDRRFRLRPYEGEGEEEEEEEEAEEEDLEEEKDGGLLECAERAGFPGERQCFAPEAAAAAKARFHAQASPGFASCNFGGGECAGRVFDLQPGGIVALDNFTSPKILRGFQRIFSTRHDYEHIINGALSQEYEYGKPYKPPDLSIPPEDKGAPKKGPRAPWATARARVWCPVLRRIRKAAEAHLKPNLTVPVNILQNTFSDRTHCVAQLRPGSSSLLSALRFLDSYGGYKGRFFVDHAMQRRYSSRDPSKNVVTPHTDTDFEGRCLSAALYVGDDALIADRNVSGVFQTYTCVKGECHGLYGDRLMSTYERGVMQRRGNVVAVQRSPYITNRLVLFASETPHGVTHLRVGDQRDIFFVWLTCHRDFEPEGGSSTGRDRQYQRYGAAGDQAKLVDRACAKWWREQQEKRKKQRKVETTEEKTSVEAVVPPRTESDESDDVGDDAQRPELEAVAVVESSSAVSDDSDDASDDGAPPPDLVWPFEQDLPLPILRNAARLTKLFQSGGSTPTTAE